MAWIRVLLALGLSPFLAPMLAELGVAAALAIADTCSTLLLLMLYVRVASTPMAQAIVPQRADFTSVLRRVSRP